MLFSLHHSRLCDLRVLLYHKQCTVWLQWLVWFFICLFSGVFFVQLFFFNFKMTDALGLC